LNELEEIKSRVDIVELIGGYVQLKQTGKNFKACCPFHSEKTPSFVVSPERQMWHCFGSCNEGGDIFSFVMKTDGLTFPEAVDMLAQKAGVKIERKNFERNEEKSKYYSANGLAADYYNELLLRPIGLKAKEYLKKKRGLSDATIKAYSLGFSPSGKNDLESELSRHKLTREELSASGLVANKSGEWRDLFWNRLMFPIRDISGRTIGFSARTLDPEGIPKYLNTPETEIYHKSNILYGIDLAKDSIRKADNAIIVEGNMDVIASHQAGVKNVVASSGTALTENQLRLILRLTKNLKLAFDVDFAGSQATRRAIELAWELGFNIKVITVPEGKDPADACEKDPKIWKEAVKNAVYVVDYLFELALNKNDKKDSMGKKYIAKELLPIIKRLPDEIEKNTYIKRLAKELAVDESSITEALKKVGAPKTTVREQAIEKPKNQIEDKNYELERNIVGLLLLFPHYLDFAINTIESSDFSEKETGQAFQKMVKYYNKKGAITESQYLTSLDKDEREQFSIYLLSAETNFSDLDDEKKAEEIYFGIKRLKKNSLEHKKKELSREVAEAETKGDKKATNELLQKMQALWEEERDLN
jgi:DNA primase